MTCENCRNLKVKIFTYEELKKKWNEIYLPESITEGYEKRILRESLKQKTPFERTRLKFIYCSKGMLNRFYIIRGRSTIKTRPGMQGCQFYL
jgi:hypothetical protein